MVNIDDKTEPLILSLISIVYPCIYNMSTHQVILHMQVITACW